MLVTVTRLVLFSGISAFSMIGPCVGPIGVGLGEAGFTHGSEM